MNIIYILFYSFSNNICTVDVYGNRNCENRICDLETKDINEITREELLKLKEPVIFKNVAENWPALEKWKQESFFHYYGEEIFHLHDTFNVTTKDLLDKGGYKMGHVLLTGGCYSHPYRPYSPLLLDKLSNDYIIPEIFEPMSTFQIGIGARAALGVPPESHPSSWFAMISGRKRWVIHPPSKKEPRSYIKRRGNCQMEYEVSEKTLVCDQNYGEVLWLPNFWWHETCGLESYSVGLGGVTYENCCGSDTKYTCPPDNIEKHRYTTSDIPYCSENNSRCEELKKVDRKQSKVDTN